jgi:AcrR family transcriptional regulator
MPRANAGTKGVPRADREQQIVRAASEIFGNVGFAGASVAAIAERSGISKPLVYQYFGSKEGLFSACLHEAGGLLAGEMERIARGDAVGLERGLRTLAGVFTLLEPQPWIWRLFFDPTAPTTGRVAEEIADYAGRISALAADGVAELMTLAGDEDPDDVSAMTLVWMSIFDALVTWWLDHPDQTAAEMTERCARLFGVVLGSEMPSPVRGTGAASPSVGRSDRSRGTTVPAEDRDMMG